VVQTAATLVLPLDTSRAFETRAIGFPGLATSFFRVMTHASAPSLRSPPPEGVAEEHVRSLKLVQQAATDATGRSLVVNAAGAVGAVLSDLG
jgi:hypothetical protein